MIRNTIKSILFLGIGIVLAYYIQKVLIPVWAHPHYSENISHTMKDYYELEENTVDVLFVGTSHVVYGVSPMEIYDATGITSYNLGTSAQRVWSTYYVLREGFKSQSPKVVMLDASSLFIDDDLTAYWRYFLDVMPISENKFEAALEFSKINYKEDDYSGRTGSVLSVLFPVFAYHDRWKELKEINFIDFFSDNTYFTKGYKFDTRMNGVSISVEDMNSKLFELGTDIVETMKEAINGEVIARENESILYPKIEISDRNIEALSRINQLCNGNGARLILIKVPSVSKNPANYNGGWTVSRYLATKDLVEKMDIEYVDLVYDSNPGIDWKTDTIDEGQHLNYYGATKVSDLLAYVLKYDYGIEPKESSQYNKSLNTFYKVRERAELQIETDLREWLTKAKNLEDGYTLFVAGYRDFTAGLSIQEMKKARDLGLFKNFSIDDVRGQSYIAVIKNGENVYEGTDNRTLKHRYSDEEVGNVDITSNGMTEYYDAKISINNKEQCVNSPGLNFVLYDNAEGEVIDSVCFGTCKDEDNHTVRHINQVDYLNSYMWDLYMDGWN